ncbi:MAG: gliding motility protein GldL [Tannerella sp.]|jgi:gliding motility-associated protein GldL|nr:gliding motility protein GldL [Tannerella sp.]
MGKYNRYKNRFEMFLSSDGGKRFLNFLYSWGAAVVIIGALFKIVHLPYANQILFIAMITEACVFLISAFERPSSDYHWDEVFPVLKSKNPLDRPEFAGGSGAGGGLTGGVVGGVVLEDEGGSAGSGRGFTDSSGNFTELSGNSTELSGNRSGGGRGFSGGGGGGVGGGAIVIGDISGLSGGAHPQGTFPQGTTPQGQPDQQSDQRPSPQSLVNAGMSKMGINVSEEDAELLAESIKKLNGAAEQISKMADLTDATQAYIDKIHGVTENLERVSEITASLGEVSDTLVNSCRVITGDKAGDGGEEKTVGYVERMSRLNDNLSNMNHFYETQLNGLRSQMDTIQHINSGLNRIRDLYDTSLVDTSAFRNENERMAQLLSQLNQVYSRLLQAMTVNMQAVNYQPSQTTYQPPYPTGGFR